VQPSAALLKPCRCATPLQAQTRLSTTNPRNIECSLRLLCSNLVAARPRYRPKHVFLLSILVTSRAAYGCSAQTLSLRDPATGPNFPSTLFGGAHSSRFPLYRAMQKSVASYARIATKKYTTLIASSRGRRWQSAIPTKMWQCHRPEIPSFSGRTSSRQQP